MRTSASITSIATISALAAASAATACDPSYTLNLSTTVRAQGAPVAGADLPVELAGAKCAAAKRVALACGDGRCELAVDEPSTSFCEGYVVSVEPARATAAWVPETPADRAASRHAWSFARASAFVAVCDDGRGAVSIVVAE